MDNVDLYHVLLARKLIWQSYKSATIPSVFTTNLVSLSTMLLLPLLFSAALASPKAESCKECIHEMERFGWVATEPATTPVSAPIPLTNYACLSLYSPSNKTSQFSPIATVFKIDPPPNIPLPFFSLCFSLHQLVLCIFRYFPLNPILLNCPYSCTSILLCLLLFSNLLHLL